MLYSRVKRRGDTMLDLGGRVPVCGFGGLCTDRAISRKTGLPVPEEHLLAVVGRHF